VAKTKGAPRKFTVHIDETISSIAKLRAEHQENATPNPYDADEVAHAIRGAIEMRKEERIERHRVLMKRIRHHSACNWMLSFLRALRSCCGRLRAPARLVVGPPLALPNAPAKLIAR
jgi:hypothetical protein